MTGAAVFDLDKTLIASSVTLALGPDLVSAGILSTTTMVRGAVAGAIYVRFGASSDSIVRTKEGVSRTIRGLEVQRFLAVLDERLEKVIAPLIYEEGRQAIAEQRAQGRPIVIASSSGIEAVQRVADMLDADHVIATESRIVDGRYTGEVPFFAFAEEKARAVRSLAEEQGWDLADSTAYSDSHTDLPLLELVGHPYAVNPDRALREVAESRGWPVLTFRRAHRPKAIGLIPRETARVTGNALSAAASGVGSSASRAVGGLRTSGSSLARRVGRGVSSRGGQSDPQEAPRNAEGPESTD